MRHTHTCAHAHTRMRTHTRTHTHTHAHMHAHTRTLIRCLLCFLKNGSGPKIVISWHSIMLSWGCGMESGVWGHDGTWGCLLSL